MQRAVILAALACRLLTAAVPAFPGAEGFGAQTPGGRNGKILFVRNLNDAGPGSFREAVNEKGPRIVVFRVGGLITLESPVKITEPYLTIAGQSAPGDGICFRGSEVSIQTHDVIVRYLRSRPGDIAKGEVDAINIVGDSHDVILDHCSASWSIDEALSPSGAIYNVTVQWCIIAEGLNRSHHSKGEHGYGSLVRSTGGVTLHHNLWAHNLERNPRLGDNYGRGTPPTFDVRNNVMYGYGKLCSGWTGDRLNVNYISNYIRPDAGSNLANRVIALLDTAAAVYYLDGNIVDGHPDWTASPLALFAKTEVEGRKLVTIAPKAFDAPPVHTTSAEQAFRDVLAGAGCTIPHRDPVDARIVSEVQSRSGSIIDSQWEVGGWPEYRSARPPRDADNDGVPDDWALAANSPAGYTKIELYLNSIRGAVNSTR